MGLRPGGSSSITDTSRSPYKVIANVRGMGVAVITSTWGGMVFFARVWHVGYTETVLLVDDYQADILKKTPHLRASMGTDQNFAGYRPVSPGEFLPARFVDPVSKATVIPISPNIPWIVS